MDKKLAFPHLTKKPVSLMLCFNENCSKWHIALPNDANKSVVSKEQLVKEETTFTDKDICNPPLSLPDILSSKMSVSRTVSPKDLTKYVEFGRDIFNIKINEPLAEKKNKSDDSQKNVLVKNEHLHTHVHKSK